jgi:3-hydroxymyristoyl/3-hydroxydecanoyl-(acyl carrier protein) dehydratase
MMGEPHRLPCKEHEVSKTVLRPGRPSLIDIDATFLPTGHMRQVARVVRLEGPEIEGEVDLGAGHWVFPEHFPGDPIFPGSLLIEAAGQLVALWAWANGQRGRPRLVRCSAEFHSPVGPSALCVSLRAEVRRKRHLHFSTIEIWAEATHLATLEAVLAVLAVLPPN